MNVQQRVKTLGWLSIALGAPALLAPEALGRLIGVTNQDTLLRAIGVRELVAGVGLLTQGRATPWVWARVVGDAMDLSLLLAALARTPKYANRIAGTTGVIVAITSLDAISVQQVAAQAA